jgi:hypothetical protein
MRDLSDAIDELARDRDDAGEREDAISRKAISGDAEIWTERFASRLRDPGEPISRSKAGFERFRAIDANSRATCATPATSFFSALVPARSRRLQELRHPSRQAPRPRYAVLTSIVVAVRAW